MSELKKLVLLLFENIFLTQTLLVNTQILDIKMVFFMFTSGGSKISKLREDFHISCWDCLILNLNEQKPSSKTQNMKSWKANSALKSWNKTSQLVTYLYLTIATLILANDYVIFKVSWSDQFWKWSGKLKWQSEWILCAL